MIYRVSKFELSTLSWGVSASCHTVMKSENGLHLVEKPVVPSIWVQNGGNTRAVVIEHNFL